LKSSLALMSSLAAELKMVRMYWRAFFHWRLFMVECWAICAREVSRWARGVLFSGKEQKKSLHLGGRA